MDLLPACVASCAEAGASFLAEDGTVNACRFVEWEATASGRECARLCGGAYEATALDILRTGCDDSGDDDMETAAIVRPFGVWGE